MPTYYAREVPGYNITTASLFLGLIAVISGFVGALSGAFVADKIRLAKFKKPLLLTTTGCIFLTIIFIIPGLYTFEKYSGSITVFLSQLCHWMIVGPSSTLKANSVPPSVRTRAFSFVILVNHIGDTVSPTLVGLLSDLTGSYQNISILENYGNYTVNMTSLEYFGDIRNGMILVPVVYSLALLFLVYAYLRVDEVEKYEVEKKEDRITPVE